MQEASSSPVADPVPAIIPQENLSNDYERPFASYVLAEFVVRKIVQRTMDKIDSLRIDEWLTRFSVLNTVSCISGLVHIQHFFPDSGESSLAGDWHPNLEPVTSSSNASR